MVNNKVIPEIEVITEIEDKNEIVANNEESKQIEEKNEIKPNKLLPDIHRIPDAGLHLYKFGLTNHYIGNNQIKRSLIFNPKLIFIMALTEILTSVMFITNEDMELFFYIGDWTAFVPGLRIHMTIAKISLFITSVAVIIINYWYATNEKSYKWLKPFEMMSGMKTPKEIGIIYNKNKFCINILVFILYIRTQ